MGFKDFAMQYMETSRNSLISDLKKRLRKMSDDELRRVINNNPDSQARDLAIEEAERRYISY